MTIFDHIELDLLKKFLVCSESQTFTQAAQRLASHTKTVRGQMIRLEQQLNVVLFLRKNKNATTHLTPEGEVLKNRLIYVFEILDGTRSIIGREKQNKRKKLRIFTTQGLASKFLPDLTAEFSQKNPEVDISVLTRQSPEILSHGEVEIRQDFSLADNLEKMYLFETRQAFYATKEYIKKYGHPRKFSDLIGHRILFSLALHERIFRKNNDVYVQSNIESSSINFLIAVAKKSMGIVSHPDFFKEPDLVRVLEDVYSDPIQINVGYIRTTPFESPMWLFLEYIKRKIKKMD